MKCRMCNEDAEINLCPDCTATYGIMNDMLTHAHALVVVHPPEMYHESRRIESDIINALEKFEALMKADRK